MIKDEKKNIHIYTHEETAFVKCITKFIYIFSWWERLPSFWIKLLYTDYVDSAFMKSNNLLLGFLSNNSHEDRALPNKQIKYYGS